MSRRSAAGLEGLRVAITASRRAKELARLVSSFGGTPLLVPTVAISLRQRGTEGVEQFIRATSRGEVNLVLFMTGIGVHLLMEGARRLGVLRSLTEALNSEGVLVVARSAKPRGALSSFGIKTDIVPPEGSATTDGLLHLLQRLDLRGATVGVVWPGSRSEQLVSGLLAAGVRRVIDSSTYVYAPRLERRAGKALKAMGYDCAEPSAAEAAGAIRRLAFGERPFDVITFTSPPSVRNFFDIAELNDAKESVIRALNGHVVVVAVGPSTRSAIEEAGAHVDVMPATPKMGPMVIAMSEHIRKTEHERRPRDVV